MAQSVTCNNFPSQHGRGRYSWATSGRSFSVSSYDLRPSVSKYGKIRHPNGIFSLNKNYFITCLRFSSANIHFTHLINGILSLTSNLHFNNIPSFPPFSISDGLFSYFRCFSQDRNTPYRTGW